MCAYCVGSNASYRCPSSHGSAQIAFHSNDVEAKTISSSPEIKLFQPIPPTTPHFPSDTDTLIPIPLTQHTYEDSVNPAHIVQPPDDVIDYWFDRLGLSLDISLGTLSDLPNLSSSISVLDDIDLSVSSILYIGIRGSHIQ